MSLKNQITNFALPSDVEVRMICICAVGKFNNWSSYGFGFSIIFLVCSNYHFVFLLRNMIKKMHALSSKKLADDKKNSF